MIFKPRCLHVLIAGTLLGLVSAEISAAPRDVQFRSVDLINEIVELHNFGAGSEPLDGWRFCTHDESTMFRYTGLGQFAGVSIDPGTSIFFHWNDVVQDDTNINMNSLGGLFAAPLDAAPFSNGAFGLGIYTSAPFFTASNMVDHLQWSVRRTRQRNG